MGERRTVATAINEWGTPSKLLLALALSIFAAGGAWAGLTLRVGLLEKDVEATQEKLHETRDTARDVKAEIKAVRELIELQSKADKEWRHEIMELLKKKGP